MGQYIYTFLVLLSNSEKALTNAFYHSFIKIKMIKLLSTAPKNMFMSVLKYGIDKSTNDSNREFIFKRGYLKIIAKFKPHILKKQSIYRASARNIAIENYKGAFIRILKHYFKLDTDPLTKVKIKDDKKDPGFEIEYRWNEVRSHFLLKSFSLYQLLFQVYCL